MSQMPDERVLDLRLDAPLRPNVTCPKCHDRYEDGTFHSCRRQPPTGSTGLSYAGREPAREPR
jgi:hypothetical protein